MGGALTTRALLHLVITQSWREMMMAKALSLGSLVLSPDFALLLSRLLALYERPTATVAPLVPDRLSSGCLGRAKAERPGPI